MTPGQHLQPDHSKGDESTIGGYSAVHARPAAFEGRDGMSYSLEILTDVTAETAGSRRFGAYLVFLRWRRMGEQGVDGHLETDFLAWGETAARAKAAVGEMRLSEAQRVLDALITSSDATPASRRWRDVRRAEDGEP